MGKLEQPGQSVGLRYVLQVCVSRELTAPFARGRKIREITLFLTT